MKNKKIFGLAFVVIVAILIVFATLIYSGFFTSTDSVQARAVDTYATKDSVETLSDSINDFSFDMYEQLGKGVDDNVFFSPYSIFVALAMTYEGAEGDTADEMRSVLGFEQNDEVSLCSFGRIYNLLNIDAEYTLNTANALWTQKDFSFLESYLNFINNYYMGRATDVDYSNAEEAASIINSWVEENTNGKIEDLILPSDINPLTRLILTNAIYFKGDWLYQFDADLTSNMNFKTSPGNNVSVPMMQFSDSDFELNFTETDDLKILELPYKGDKLSMIILLPNDNDISVVEDNLNYTNYKNWIGSLYKTEVNVVLPKFKHETEYSLKEKLIQMGMVIPFTESADFSGMTGVPDLFIDKVKHKAFIEVNEEGTEAAAATSVHMKLTAVIEGKEFHADHPFIYLIQHKETDTILFIGKITNPQ